MKNITIIFIILGLLFPVIGNCQLRKGEVSINYQLDDKAYSAVVTRPEWKESVTVQLCDRKDVSLMPNNARLYTKDNAQKIYRLLFQPLERYINTGDNVYFHPRGCLYVMNVAAFMDNDGKRLCEKYNFFRLSDIRAFPKDPKGHACQVLLYGGMDYDADTEEMNKHCWFYHTSDRQKYFNDIQSIKPSDIDFGYTPDGTRAGLGNLKESKGEIKFIYHLNKYFGNPVTGAAALEEAFRQDIRRDEEYIVHLSTHTFNAYFPDGDSDNYQEQELKYFLSCGLLFSGAGHTLRGEKMPNAHTVGTSRTLGPMNDGLLNGVEIASLDMSNCSMVVLAACNTALGVVYQSGFMGLQDAFKDAGVQTILMTLWSVDDKATSEFMKSFYTYLFSGKTKHEALNLARADLMHSEDFSDPTYWAPFIMLD